VTKILLQTTIPFTEDDWNVSRFSLLHKLMASMDGVSVVARDRARAEEDDPGLASLADSDFDQLWLIAVDGGDGLTSNDCDAITAFAKRGGAILTARDHQDCGASICTLGGVGAAHFFHSKQQDPDPSRRRRDDRDTSSIDWPNYHSGNNGDYQHITPIDAAHPLLQRTDGSTLEWFPAHPHEGAVGAPQGDASARVIANGTSSATGREFPLVVALERTAEHGRALAHSSFHHFCDYNWDLSAGCPSFVEEAPGSELEIYPERLNDVRTYVRNAVRWLSS
jgi:hypothetical protein